MEGEASTYDNPKVRRERQRETEGESERERDAVRALLVGCEDI